MSPARRPAAAPAHATILDDSYSPPRRGCTSLTRTYQLGRHVIRVQVHRDSHDFQSYATADVLTPGLTWTRLAEQPPAYWHAATASGGQDVLAAVADALRTRVQTILAALPEPATPPVL
jgi:hypothetical protein